MREAIRIHTEVTGARPLGWYTGRSSIHTIELAMEEGGFLYSSDTYADDLPYWIEGPRGPHLIIPYTLDANDMRFATPQGFNAGDQFFAYLKDSFDALYAEGEAGAPKMMSVGLHCRLVGRPGRAAALARFLDYVQAKDRGLAAAAHRHRPALARAPSAGDASRWLEDRSLADGSTAAGSRSAMFDPRTEPGARPGSRKPRAIRRARMQGGCHVSRHRYRHLVGQGRAHRRRAADRRLARASRSTCRAAASRLVRAGSRELVAATSKAPSTRSPRRIPPR